MISNVFRFTTLLALLTACFLLGGWLVGGTTGALLSGGCALLLDLGAYFLSDRLILRMSGARQLHHDELPWLVHRVDAIARCADMPPPRLYLMDSATPNAFATGRTPARAAVALTTGITNLLTRDELAGVMAHELAHIRRRDTLVSGVVAVCADALTMLAAIGQCKAPLMAGQHQASCRAMQYISGVLLMLVAPLIVLLVKLGLSREREYLADKDGAALLGDPLPLASALEKIEWATAQLPMLSNPGTASLYFVNPLCGESRMLQFFRTHPTTEKRVAQLRALARQGCV
jgi:heat shock protein HtpX